MIELIVSLIGIGILATGFRVVWALDRIAEAMWSELCIEEGGPGPPAFLVGELVHITRHRHFQEDDDDAE